MYGDSFLQKPDPHLAHISFLTMSPRVPKGPTTSSSPVTLRFNLSTSSETVMLGPSSVNASRNASRIISIDSSKIFCSFGVDSSETVFSSDLSSSIAKASNSSRRRSFSSSAFIKSSGSAPGNSFCTIASASPSSLRSLRSSSILASFSSGDISDTFTLDSTEGVEVSSTMSLSSISSALISSGY